MTTTFQAVFIKGVLRPLGRLNLAENQVVTLRVETPPAAPRSSAHVVTLKGLWPLAAQQSLEDSLAEVRQLAENRLDSLAGSLSSPAAGS